ncbi:TlpA family protein disulfide reductase [Ramlibacter albus]|uniref:TlpA family protein disulfide reductase n=1 Tax=Ramlibacter albus TaxID=2079448 RepID=A0A923M8D1_9BURK|nr:TlpA disulfide reductase family protein [Ramlibacter albus]MBC5764726.1 TlpA family protein disulfide reductase [Ramlibacter albus]
MKRLFAALLSLPLAALALAPGEPAPAFELPGPDGAMVRLADFKGKTVYLDFWASWCVPCRQSFPWMNDMQARYGDRNLRVIGINVDKRASDAGKFLDRTPAKFQVAFDPAGNAPRAYDVKAMPSSVLVGPDGRVLAVHRGFSEEDKAPLEARIREALGVK